MLEEDLDQKSNISPSRIKLSTQRKRQNVHHCNDVLTSAGGNPVFIYSSRKMFSHKAAQKSFGSKKFNLKDRYSSFAGKINQRGHLQVVLLLLKLQKLTFFFIFFIIYIMIISLTVDL